MAATLAILVVALVASTSAAAANQNARRPTSAVYEWAVQSNPDPRFFNTENTYTFVDRQSQSLTWQVEAIRSVTGLRMDLQVLSQNQKGQWRETENHRNVRLNSPSTPQIVTAYAIIAGMQDSSPAVIGSQNLQASPSSAAAQSAEASSGQSAEASAAQSAERSFAGGARPSIAKAAKSSPQKGFISLENFRPSKSQISSQISAGRKVIQITFKDSNNKNVLNTSLLVNFRK